MKFKDVKIGMQVCYQGDITDAYTVIGFNNKKVTLIQEDTYGKCEYDFLSKDLEVFDAVKAKQSILDIQNDINEANSYLEKTFQLIQAIKKKSEENGMETPFNKNVLAWEEFTHTLSTGSYYWRISSLEC